MRKLMWFTIGFAVSCGLWVYTMPDPPILPLFLLIAAVFAFGCIASVRWKWLRCGAVAAVGAMIALWLLLGYQMFYLEPVRMVDGGTYSITLTVSDFSYETEYGIAADCTGTVAGKQVKFRAYLDDVEEVAPGDTLSGAFRLKMTTPGGEKESDYHAGSGIFCLAYQSGKIEHRPGDSSDLRYFPIFLREKIRSVLSHVFPEDVFPFVQALLLGDSGLITYELDTAFKISGIRHIIAISGLHVSVFYGLISLFTFRKRYLTALICIPVLLLFAAVAGFTPSVTRACIMIILMILAQVFNREYDSPTALSFACLVMLAVNPFVIASVSFQLSAGCVMGILLFSSRINNRIIRHFNKTDPKSPGGRLLRFLSTSFSVTLGAMSLTTPLCAYYFGMVSLIGIVTNLLTLWAVNLLFNGVIVTILLSLLSLPAAAVCGRVLAWIARYICGCAQLFARFPLAAVYTKSIYIVIWLVFMYVLLAAFLLLKKKKPGILICCAVLGLCVSLLASWLEPYTHHTRLTVLDVGQGQAILIRTGGRNILIDCGGDTDEAAADCAANTLLSQGTPHLDALIITHPDRDHAGGISCLLSRISTDLLLLPGSTQEEALADLPAECVENVLWVTENLTLSIGSSTITIFAPPMVKDGNENSLCVLYEGNGCAILVTGDRSSFGEGILLKENSLPDVDVLIAGHHGSKYSTSEELLRTVKPETVIISVGRENYYGHPAPELLQRLADFGCTVYRTDLHGTVVYRK